MTAVLPPLSIWPNRRSRPPCEVFDAVQAAGWKVAPDYPGFGLSAAPGGYRYTVAEHARILEGFIDRLDLRDITMMVQDWGGPIGMWAATRHPERFRAFVIGNTWAWPSAGDKTSERFSKLMGSAWPGGFLVKRADVFVNVFMRNGIKRKKLTPAEWAMYKGPHPTPASRVPVHVMPREILTAHEFLAEVSRAWARSRASRRLSCGPTKIRPSGNRSGCAGNRPSPITAP